MTSEQEAENVNSDILRTTHELSKYPEMFPRDKYKRLNKGSFRAFEKHHYRVAYRISPHAIRILAVRHTSRRPPFLLNSQAFRSAI